MKHNQVQDQQYLASPVMSSFYYDITPNQTPNSSSNSSDASSTPDHDHQEISKKKKTNKTSCIKPTFYACRLREHVKMGPKFSETVKGKLSLGAKIIQKGGRENIFKQIFGMDDDAGEKLLKASQCYLFTTGGPIAGILFISTQKVAFCSERPISFPSPTGESVKRPYKVMIPTKKIKRACESENVDHPSQKYIEVVTEDNFEFWFMGFVRYEKAFKNLQKAISLSN